MITSGWILPDMVGVPCKSSSGFKEHIFFVKDYLDKLYEDDEKLFFALMDLRKNIHPECYSLDDFAVKILGWIKVTNEPFRQIFLINLHEYDDIISKYLDLGYTVTFFTGRAPIKIKNPSKYI